MKMKIYGAWSQFALLSERISVKHPFFLLSCLLGVFLCFFPEFAWAESTSSMSFSPPPSDLSVVFLRDVFGTVDGVLAGGGSQILGVMFGVFNAAVLSLGGIIIMYTLLIGTINTAEHGEVLGKNWSSVWIPIRTTLGLSLLFTYSSGYSILQIFFMWVIVQGVGAADLIWNAALGYLQQGGVLVQPIMTSSASMIAGNSSTGSANSVITGASDILAGTTCMTALQTQLDTMYQLYSSQAATCTGPCAPYTGTSTCSGYVGSNCSSSGLSTSQVDMCNFCTNGSPTDLLGSVDIAAAQAASIAEWNSGQCGYQASGSSSASPTYAQVDGAPGNGAIPPSSCYINSISINMPNFDSSSPYATLNGICGSITYGTMEPEFQYLLSIYPTAQGTPTSTATVSGTGINGCQITSSSGMSLGEMTELASNTAVTRGVAVQQMYSDMSLVAQTMVNNDLSLNEYTNLATPCQPGGGQNCYFTSASYTASSPLGVPSASSSEASSCLGYYNGTGSDATSPSCTEWASPSSSFSQLLNGTELQGAISDYNSIMEPALNLLQNYATIGAATSFVSCAESNGWIMAGAYLYNLTQVNQTDANTTVTDSYSYVGNSIYPPSISNFCTGTTASTGSSSPTALCTWYGAGNSSNSSTYSNQITVLFQGPTPDNTANTAPQPNYSYGYGSQWPIPYLSSELNSTVNGYTANAANVIMPNQPGTSAPTFTFSWVMPTVSLGALKACTKSGYLSIPGLICRMTVGYLLQLLLIFINFNIAAFFLIMEAILALPIMAFDAMFNQAASMFNNAVVSPVVVIAGMGNMFINTAVNIMFMLAIITSVASAATAGVIMPALAMFLAFVGPLIISWLGMIFSMGIEAAYYIPFTPYIIFTFATFGWLIGVLEAMVAAPLVALGVCLPEGGHDVFGKGVESLYLLFNSFLRPSMMILGYIGGFILSSVGIWMINTGFSYFETTFMQAAPMTTWTVLFSQTFFFGIYFTLCAGIVTRSYEVIYKLPDAVMKWIGGQHATALADTVGDITSQVQSRVKDMGAAMQKGIESASLGDTSKKKTSKKPENSNVKDNTPNTPV